MIRKQASPFSMLVGLVVVLAVANTALSQEEKKAAEAPAPAATTAAPAPAGPTLAELKVMADTAWTLVTGMLVFFMNLGFACVDSGFCRAKNAVNILSKNFVVFAATSIGFWFLG